MIVVMKNDKVYDSYEVDISFMTTKPQLSKIMSLLPDRKQRFYGEELIAGGDVIKVSDVKSVKLSEKEIKRTVSKMPSRKHDIFHASRKGGWAWSRKWKHIQMMKKLKKRKADSERADEKI